ncbi:uncharacterized protein QC763_0087610 [Podospora pseudopauciseta]|uniref:Uncharacterized protein n=1 Tax=Podospora pseudopauciseta TaxID=2093780 RepID=A0ABR0H961_9PEZI|nr:hypothetical protein QC763_0087610 [Podospora pseudopauciseta]
MRPTSDPSLLLRTQARDTTMKATISPMTTCFPSIVIGLLRTDVDLLSTMSAGRCWRKPSGPSLSLSVQLSRFSIHSPW